jgi:hypothetical protein
MSWVSPWSASTSPAGTRPAAGQIRFKVVSSCIYAALPHSARSTSIDDLLGRVSIGIEGFKFVPGPFTTVSTQHSKAVSQSRGSLSRKISHCLHWSQVFRNGGVLLLDELNLASDEVITAIGP